MRIVSLLPSATEIVCSLGLEEQLVGVTHECDYPPAVRALPKVTRTLVPAEAESGEIDRLVGARVAARQPLYALDLPTLERLRPDLIVTQALCEVCAVAESEVRAAACALPGEPRVVNLEPTSLDQVLAAIEEVAVAAGVAPRGRAVIGGLRRRIDAVAARVAAQVDRPRTILLEWIDPPFTCGHWNPELVRLAGGIELLGWEGERSRRASWEEIVQRRPEVLVVACCGFDVERTMRDLPILTRQTGWAELPCVRDDRVYVVDGSAYFNRPGPRLVDSLEILAELLHPELRIDRGPGSVTALDVGKVG